MTTTAIALQLIQKAALGDLNALQAVLRQMADGSMLFDELDATTLKIGGTAITATATELNQVDNSARVMTAGSGINGAGVVYKSGVHRVGDLIYTRIFVDLTDLTSGGTALDIVGGAGGDANSHFGQVTAALNGTIVAGYIDWIETPAGGGTDIDLYSAVEGTGAEDAGITTLDETLLCNAGAASAGDRKILSAFPAADEYLYLAEVAGTDAAFTAGQFELVLIGTA